MSDRVTMPALGESVTEGTVTRWLKNIGDSVEVDEPLLEVSTDKVDTEIPSPVAGTLQEILAQEDETVPVGADLAVIGEGAASGGSGDSEGGATAESSEASAPSSQPAASGSGSDDASAPEPEQPEPEAPSTEQPMAPQTSEPEADQAQGGGGQQQSSGGQQQSSGGQQPSGGGSGSGGSAGQTVTMPALGESVTEGTVTRWLKSEGDTVEVDEALLEVSTDKVDTEIPSPVAGVVSKILVQEDEVVPVGGDLVVIGGEAGAADDAGGGDQAAAGAEAPAQPSAEQQAPSARPEATAPQESAQPSEEQQEAKPSSEQEAPAQATAQQGTEAAGQAASSGDGSGADASPTTATGSAREAAAPATATAPSSSTATGGSDGGTDESAAYVTPLVRKLAAQHSVDLGSLTGTGIGGRIRKQDVLDAAEQAKAAAAQPAAPAAPAAAAPSTPSAPAASAASSAPAEASPKRGTTEKMSRLRKVIAQRMVESLQVSAQLTTVVEVDLTKVARLRARAKNEFERREGVKLSYLPFLALAAVEALKTHPNVNASVEGEEIIYHGQENLSIAVDTEKGLIVPVVKNAGDLNIAGLARAIADLADRTRNNKIMPDDLAGGTFTITNTGSRGALFDTPIINQPQVAILGTGALVKRPVVVTDVDGGETIAVRSMMYLALSYDHRIVDGADAARFLGAMKTRLEEGRFEASLGL
ncbi:MAG TPA: 2-oxoglutarate dehydrogenase, E2 component, dihydrolipoamide succinyltransferase [Lapillicoccus sp.]|jgi:pyruvate dehydrogenase E2 component (dihydrolipoamide acetyltransferase)|nr:2-oxoglutarate dehydrogenase, E2 component, dihydrolipoamide succinyltransferase [Lapillicoccus sp.]